MPIILNTTFNLLALLYYKRIVGELLILKKINFEQYSHFILNNIKINQSVWITIKAIGRWINQTRLKKLVWYFKKHSSSDTSTIKIDTYRLDKRIYLWICTNLCFNMQYPD